MVGSDQRMTDHIIQFSHSTPQGALGGILPLGDCNPYFTRRLWLQMLGALLIDVMYAKDTSMMPQLIRASFNLYPFLKVLD